MFVGIEISEEQRKQAIINARRAKQGKKKSKEMLCLLPFRHSHINFYKIVVFIYFFEV